MKISRKAGICLLLLAVSILIHLYSRDSHRVESAYSLGFYAWFSKLLRFTWGWLPFSLGDLLYGIVVFYLLYKLAYWPNSRSKIYRGKRNRLIRIVNGLLLVYIIFNVMWGINYNRRGIASQLGISMGDYQLSDLRQINGLLADKVNTSKKALLLAGKDYPSSSELYQKVNEAYKSVSAKYPFLKYSPASIKTSMWGWLGNYSGFTGYYNPFTGEAQLNTTVPEFLQPFIACHEVGHQIGYAKEMEANFVGYLAASASQDTLLHYSVYLDLFAYANRNLFQEDSVSARQYYQTLDTRVRQDLEEWRQFNRRHSNPVEPAIRWVYGKFLKGNGQPEGILAYDKVTAFIISYYRKYGRI